MSKSQKSESDVSKVNPRFKKALLNKKPFFGLKKRGLLKKKLIFDIKCLDCEIKKIVETGETLCLSFNNSSENISRITWSEIKNIFWTFRKVLKIKG